MTHVQAVKLSNRIQENGLSRQDIETLNKAAAIAHAEASRLEKIWEDLLNAPEGDPWDEEEALRKCTEAREHAYKIEYASIFFK